MKRSDAVVLVRQHGGLAQQGVTKRTTRLFVGELGWPLLKSGDPSSSLAKARRYGIPIASECRFLELVGASAPDDEVKSFTAQELASIGKLPAEVVEQLSIFGLIEARGGLFGFRDVAAARQIARLFACGTTLSTVTRSLHNIRKWLPDAASGT